MAALALVLSYAGAAVGAVGSQWQNLRHTVQERAVVDVGDEFPGGLTAWTGAEDLAPWLERRAVWPGRLGLFRPSLPLSDYRLEFTAILERGGLGWVFRAADTRNYYAMTVTLLESKPPYAAAVTHYAVVNGRPGPKTRSPHVIYLRPNRRYAFQAEIRGSEFITALDGRVIDTWRDGRFASGGVGFFTGRGQRARLLGVRVVQHDDLLGELCGWLAR